MTALEPKCQMVDASLVVTGDSVFLRRYDGLIESLRERVRHVEAVTSGNVAELTWVRVFNRMTRGTRLHRRFTTPAFDRTVASFAMRSKQTSRKIARRSPDLVLHVFGSFAPYWAKVGTPYAMYLDYTMALARANWPPWAAFASESEYLGWLACERRTYRRASLLFVMNEVTRQSLIADYGVDEARIHLVRSAGYRSLPPIDHARRPGSRLLFNASDPARKGADIVRAAFTRVRRAIPDAVLEVVGGEMEPDAGIVNRGMIDRDAMARLFATVDLVLAPARCDSVPGLVIEGMSHGVPALVSAVSGIAEILTDDVNGVVIDKPGVEVVAEAVIGLLQDESRLRTLGANARATVSAGLTWDAIAATMASRLAALV
jgi:glycosyltransferase involved in cell wall biosynthesis